MSLKLCSINIEGDKHLDSVEQFLLKERPDVVCLQEAFAVDLPRLTKSLGMRSEFAPMTRMEVPTRYGFSLRGPIGVAILTALPLKDVRSDFYRGTAQHVPLFEEPNSPRRVLLSAIVEKDGQPLRLATTHFTWSPGGQTTQEQLDDAVELQKAVSQFDSLTICGDFNAPRGGGVYEQLVAAGWRDWVPESVTTTLDPQLHYAGKLDLVVDYFFTVGPGKIDQVSLATQVSDHQALVGEVGARAV